MSSPCLICQNSEGNVPFEPREMMYGFRDRFSYFECAKCGCLQLDGELPNLEKYYPKDYYSFSRRDAAPGERRSWLKQFLRERLLRTELGHPDLLGWLMQRLYPRRRVLDFLKGQKLDINYHSSIVDVGSGAGELLLEMRLLGFTNLLGVDPFIDAEIVYPPDLRIRKCYLRELEGTFDLVMMNHAFEHVPDPLATLKDVAQRLNPNGVAVISGPMAGTYAWRHYGIDWVALDAPRHLFVPTLRSMEILAAAAGLEVFSAVHNSAPFTFWASEQYKQDIPLQDPRSVLKNPPHGIFTEAQMQDFARRADELNRRGDADAAAVLLRRAA